MVECTDIRKESVKWVTPGNNTAKMSLVSVQTFAEKYFNSLNPIAERISIDVAATKDAYENLWHTLSYKDRSQVIDETIIHPEAVLKYSCAHEEPEVECFPHLRLQTGNKYVTDDEGGKISVSKLCTVLKELCHTVDILFRSSVIYFFFQGLTWRDEHSAPFTWMTQSQLNLCVTDNAEHGRKPQNTAASMPGTYQQKLKVSPHKKFHAPHSSVSFIDPPDIVLGGSSSKLVGTISSKLKFPPKSGTGDDNLLTKIRNKTAVLKIHTLKSTASKTSGDNSVHSNEAEREILVQSKYDCAVIPSLKLPKPGGGKAVISKPKTPPPPPPCKQKPQTVPSPQINSEKVALLQESPADELAGLQPAKCDHEDNHDVGCSNGSLDSLDNFHLELKIPSRCDTVPKTGFDFLDNW
jgi:hypothetical protein